MSKLTRENLIQLLNMKQNIEELGRDCMTISTTLNYIEFVYLNKDGSIVHVDPENMTANKYKKRNNQNNDEVSLVYTTSNDESVSCLEYKKYDENDKVIASYKKTFSENELITPTVEITLIDKYDVYEDITAPIKYKKIKVGDNTSYVVECESENVIKYQNGDIKKEYKLLNDSVSLSVNTNGSWKVVMPNVDAKTFTIEYDASNEELKEQYFIYDEEYSSLKRAEIVNEITKKKYKNLSSDKFFKIMNNKIMPVFRNNISDKYESLNNDLAPYIFEDKGITEDEIIEFIKEDLNQTKEKSVN